MRKKQLQVLLPVNWNEVSALWYTIRVEGPENSGIELDQSRANSALLLGRVLFYIEEKIEYCLTELGSFADGNSVPETASAVIGIAEENEGILTGLLEILQEQFTEEYLGSEGKITLTLKREGPGALPGLHPVDLQKLVFYLIQLPDGVQKTAAPGSLQADSYCHLNQAELLPDGVHIRICLGSRSESAGRMLADKLCYLTEFLGGDCQKMEQPDP
ncbi:MAG: hypothetical protein Q4B03_04490 [Lachnospiraceae bacterium]|nr:hypothetical protein [Lachnospiraceae bacterium]